MDEINKNNMDTPEKVQLDRIKIFKETGNITKQHVEYLLNLIEQKINKINELEEKLDNLRDRLRHQLEID